MNQNEEANRSYSANVPVSEYKEDAERLDPVDFFIVTQVPVETYRFKWILNQFSNIPRNMELYSCLLSSRFRLKLIKYEKGFDLFHVCDSKDNDEENIVKKEQIFFLNQGQIKTPAFDKKFTFEFGSPNTETTASREDSFPRDIEYQVSIADKNGRERIKWTTCFSNKNKSECCTIGEYRSNSWEKFFTDVLVLNCCVKVTNKPKTEKQSLKTERSLESHSWQKLSQDLKSMYQNSIDADFTLDVGGEKIPVNSSILSARSLVFKKMLCHEKEICEVLIRDVPLHAMKKLVEFLYTGTVADAAKDISIEEVYDLYYAADKYEVMDLRKMCATTLMSKASLDNASQILIWADRHSDVDLKSQILSFIGLNFETVVDSDVWRHFIESEIKLVNEVLSFCALKFKTGVDK